VKKLFAMALALAMTVSLAVDAGAYHANNQDDDNRVVWVQDGLVFEMTEAHEYASISPRDKVLFEGYCVNKTTYKTYGNCVAGEGDSINVYFDNSQGGGDIYPVYTLDGVVTSTSNLKVEKGRQYTVRISYQDGREMDGRLDVQVNTRDGHLMNFFIRARQFQYVP